MAKKVAKKDRRNERVILMCSPEEVKRIDAFCRAQRIRFRSEALRHAILSQVETWEKQAH
jgi:hypothetical protein